MLRASHSAPVGHVLACTPVLHAHCTPVLRLCSLNCSDPQHFLSWHCSYFRGFLKSTAQQGSADVVVSVHCDVEVWAWLLQWAKAQAGEPEAAPVFSAAQALPILVSSSFLGVRPVPTSMPSACVCLVLSVMHSARCGPTSPLPCTLAPQP